MLSSLSLWLGARVGHILGCVVVTVLVQVVRRTPLCPVGLQFDMSVLQAYTYYVTFLLPSCVSSNGISGLCLRTVPVMRLSVWEQVRGRPATHIVKLYLTCTN